MTAMVKLWGTQSISYRQKGVYAYIMIRNGGSGGGGGGGRGGVQNIKYYVFHSKPMFHFLMYNEML